MKSLLTTISLTILIFTVYGNDGVYLNRGSMIHPIKETSISLEKEILSFTVRDRIAQVNIQFEFNNPENKNRKLLVGFQAPTTHGDVSDELSNLNQIKNFKILKDGLIIPYNLKAAQCAGCELKDPNEFHFSQEKTGVFVYLFEVTFQPGINTVHHSYSFPASKNVAFDQIYNYILTTGSKWANGVIKDLTLQIDMGINTYFFIHDIFGQKANWSITGSGKVTRKKFYDFDTDSCTMVRMLSGILQIEVRDFRPTKDIEFGIINENSFISRTTDLAKILSGEVLELYQWSADKPYSANDLKILRNTVYAQYGYTFKDKKLLEYFSQFEWYMPDPNLILDQIILTSKEKAFTDKILKIEKE